MFQNSENFYVGTPLENTIEHAAAAIQIALLSNDPAETDRAKAIIHTVLETDDGPYNRLYLIGRIYKIERKHGNWDAAYQALERQIRMIESGHLAEIASSDTSHINFAKMNFYHKRNYVLAIRHVEVARNIADKKKGRSGTIGHIHLLHAMQNWVNEDYDESLEKISQALSVFEEYSGQSAHFVDGLAAQAIVQADAGNFEAASKILHQLNTELRSKAGTWPKLIEIYIAARQDGIQRAQEIYDGPNTKKQKMLKRLIHTYFLNILKEDGLEI